MGEESDEMVDINMNKYPHYDSLGVTFKKFEGNKNQTLLPKIRTVKNRHFYTYNPKNKALSNKINRKDFTTFSKNILKPALKLKSNLYKKLSFYKGFDVDYANLTPLSIQAKCHEYLFNMKKLKEKFIKFSAENFFFQLDGQNNSQQFFEISNNSDNYYFRIIFLIKSKEFAIDKDEIILKPTEQRTLGIKFTPSEQSVFHHCKMDVIVTNEKINELNYNDIRKKNPIREIQKKQVNNCFLGNLKY